MHTNKICCSIYIKRIVLLKARHNRVRKKQYLFFTAATNQLAYYDIIIIINKYTSHFMQHQSQHSRCAPNLKKKIIIIVFFPKVLCI